MRQDADEMGTGVVRTGAGWSVVLAAGAILGVGGEVAAQQPRFACWPEFFADGAGFEQPTVLDLDADGVLDLIRQSNPFWMFPAPAIGLGDGRFRDHVGVSLTGSGGGPLSARPGVADVDGDGRTDIIVSFSAQLPPPNDRPMLLFMNIGWVNGIVGWVNWVADQTGRLPPVRAWTKGAVFADVEPDGDLDIYVGNTQGSDFLLVNDGAGFFLDETAQRLPSALLVTPTSYVAVGDVTGDGLPDIVRAGYNTTSFVLVNSGFGVFTQGQVLGAGRQDDVDLVDVDGDGDLDVYFSSYFTSDRLWINHGGGNFVDETVLRGIHYFSDSATWVDFDGDGDVDGVLGTGESLFVEGNMRTIGPVVLQNDGNGFFSIIAGSSVSGTWSPSFGTIVPKSTAAGDFDNDGDVDFLLNFPTLLFTNQKETMMMFNLKRHIRCEPLVARGGTAQVECYADAGHLIAPVLSFAPASASLGDLGRLMVDPTAPIPLPLAFFATQGRIDRAVPIPNDPVFAGLRVYSQALDLWDEGGVPKAHLTNVTQFQIQ